MVRKTQQVETRLVSEYLKYQYGNFPFVLNQPLGKVNEDLLKSEGYAKGLRIQRPNRPEADAIVLHPKWLILIEGKVWHIIDGMAKLPLYKSLIPFTPELREYAGRDVIMELVVPWTNDNLEIMCRAADVTLKVYHPPWIADVVQRVQLYGTREYREERERKLRMRTLLDIE